jgi:eukaryotic-like serine/threonine-protein kinase
VVTEPTPGALLTPTLRLTRHLARGSMGSLWLARHDGLGAEVVVKFLCDKASSRIDVARFEREAMVLAGLQSPYIVRYLEHGVSEAGMPYLVLEHLEGCDLSVALRQHGPLEPAQVALVVEQVALALSVIHRAGIVHRDVKPSNIFLCGGLRHPPVVKLLDFGIAKSLHASEPLTSTGQMVGTPNFMSPEQFKAKAVDHRSDLWGLGVVAYRAMTGQLPFGGEALVEVIMQITAGRMAPASSLRPGLPPAVDRWFQQACALDPDHRFASAEQMAQALWEAIGPRRHTTIAPPPIEAAMVSPASSAPPGPTSLLTTLGAASLPAASLAPTTPSLHRQRGWRRFATRAAVAAAVPCALLAIGWGAAKRRADRPSGEAAEHTLSSGAANAPAATSPALSPAPPPATAAAVACPPGMAALGGAGASPTPVAAPPAYCLDVHEVTVDEYRACARSGACPPAGAATGAGGAPHRPLDALCTADLPGRDRHPINCVDWAAADAYCRHAGKRLPKAEEWEFAVRGCSGRTYPWGEEPPSANRLNGCDGECARWGAKHHVPLDALYGESDGFYATAPVGTFPRGRSVEGVDDLLGNVMEWAGDGDDAGAPPGGAPRVVMGSGWNVSSPSALRMPPRASMPAATRDPLVGFRCAAPPARP